MNAGSSRPTGRPSLMAEFARAAEGRGLEVIIAGAGGAAHLPGMVAAQTLVPVLGVPVQSHALSGHDSLLSIVQMPGGIPVGTLAIGKAGATNAALLAVAILANTPAPDLREKTAPVPPGADRARAGRHAAVTFFRKPMRLRPGDTVAVLSPSWGGPSIYPARLRLGPRQPA